MSCVIKIKDGRLRIEDAELGLVVYGSTPILRHMNTRLEGFFVQKGSIPPISLSPLLGWTFITLLLNRDVRSVQQGFLERQLWYFVPFCGKTINVYLNILRRLLKPLGLYIPPKGKGDHHGWELKHGR